MPSVLKIFSYLPSAAASCSRSLRLRNRKELSATLFQCFFSCLYKAMVFIRILYQSPPCDPFSFILFWLSEYRLRLLEPIHAFTTYYTFLSIYLWLIMPVTSFGIQLEPQWKPLPNISVRWDYRCNTKSMNNCDEHCDPQCFFAIVFLSVYYYYFLSSLPLLLLHLYFLFSFCSMYSRRKYSEGSVLCEKGKNKQKNMSFDRFFNIFLNCCSQGNWLGIF